MRCAIIDIGYNAIRAVVYENDKLGASEIFNEKFKSDILTLLEMKDLNIKHQTYLSFKYLKHIFDQLSVSKIRCVATAVLRGHPKTYLFKEIVYDKFGIDIDVISGEQEAYLTAAGLLSGISGAKGVVADLGGGSLEIALVSNKEVGMLKSLPLGTKVIASHNPLSLENITNIISQEFNGIVEDNLYLIGGSFRLIGRLYMDFSRYPLKNLHNLEIDIEKFLDYLAKLEDLSKRHPIYEEYRIDTNAILILKIMIKVFSSKKIIISNYGLKEGVRFSFLSKEEQKKDTVYERVKEWVKFDDAVCNLQNYVNVISPLLMFPDDLTLDVVKLAIMFAQFNKNIDKTLRANFAVESILASDIPFSHRQRTMLSLSLSFTYSSKHDGYINKLARKVISRYDYANSRIIGNFIKITKEIDGPEFRNPSFSFVLSGKYIEISANDILPRSVFIRLCERIKDIALAKKYATCFIKDCEYTYNIV